MELKKEGAIALLRFPQTDLNESKLRPVLLIKKLPDNFNDWLVCMISTKLQKEIPGTDEVILKASDDFHASGLKHESLIRILRLAVAEEKVFAGAIGEINSERLKRIKREITDWLTL